MTKANNKINQLAVPPLGGGGGCSGGGLTAGDLEATS